MLVKQGGGFKGSEITPYDTYLNRRAFIFRSGRDPRARAWRRGPPRNPPASRSSPPPTPPTRWRFPPTPLKDVTSYNNFYELGVDKEDPARLASDPETSPLDGPGGRRGRSSRNVRHR